jgi:hypothetical protein
MDDPKSTTDESADQGGMTIQGVAVDDQGQAISQPEEAEQTAAEGDAETSEATEPEPQQEPETPVDDNSKWLESKGIDPKSPEAIEKLAKMARESEKAMHDKAQKASKLEKSMLEQSDDSAEQIAEATGQDPELLKRLQRVEVRDAIRDFWDDNPQAKDYEEQIKQKILDSGVSGSAEAVLKAGWAMVVADNADSLKSEGKKEALKTLASKQQAAVPAGNAVKGSSANTTVITPENVNELVGRNSQEWFEKNYDAINKAMAG